MKAKSSRRVMSRALAAVVLVAGGSGAAAAGSAQAAEPPVATTDSLTTTAGTPITFTATDNDVAGDSPIDPSKTVLLDELGPTEEVDLEERGRFTVLSNGDITYSPLGEGYYGRAAVRYRITAEDGSTADGLIEVEVPPSSPAPPEAHEDVVRTEPGQPVTFDPADNDDVLAGEIDRSQTTLLENGEPTDRISLPDVGEFALEHSGEVTFTPAPGFTGVTPTVDYRVAVPEGGTDESTISVAVIAPGSVAPTANPDRATTSEEVEVELAPADNDAVGSSPIDPATLRLLDEDGSPVRDRLVTGVGYWSALGDEGVVTFEPAPGFTGTATIDYRVADEAGLASESTLTVVVETAVPPQARPDEVSTTEGTPVTLTPSENDLAADSDIVPEQTTLLDDEGQPIGGNEGPEGDWSVGGDGTVTFTPASGFTGVAPAIDYRIYDGEGDASDSTITVTVTSATEPGSDDPSSTGAEEPDEPSSTDAPDGGSGEDPDAAGSPGDQGSDPSQAGTPAQIPAGDPTAAGPRVGLVTGGVAASVFAILVGAYVARRGSLRR